MVFIILWGCFSYANDWNICECMYGSYYGMDIWQWIYVWILRLLFLHSAVGITKGLDSWCIIYSVLHAYWFIRLMFAKVLYILKILTKLILKKYQWQCDVLMVDPIPINVYYLHILSFVLVSVFNIENYLYISLKLL